MDNKSTDTTFILNDEKNTLYDRFNTLLPNMELFDCLVGYFYVSGFYKIMDSLENVDKIRILVGMGIDTKTFELLNKSEDIYASTRETKDKIIKNIITEMERSDNTIEVETGARKFIKWLKKDENGESKLEIRAYRERKTHSKLYVMTYPDNSADDGRVITGSSNLTQPGLQFNLEFNVELKNSGDYHFAKEEFDKLWENSVPVTEEYIETLPNKTWLNGTITPYELYLKFIYEFLYEKINNDKEDINIEFAPQDFKYLNYQRDAVLDAREKLKEYDGVFLSDVVGLGKTYMGALLAQQLKGTTLVIAPPSLTGNAPGSWKSVLRSFEVNAIVESRGKVDKIPKEYDLTTIKNVIIDESHIFRNEETIAYDYLYEICKNKKVILISATPFNNSPKDLLSQIKLFQPAHNSTLPNPKVKDLEKYFKDLDAKLHVLDKKENPEEYLRVSQENARDIRENILQYIMVRRTRSIIQKYYSKDLEKNEMEFPEVLPPKPQYYEFNKYLDGIFGETLDLITQELNYSRYRPLSEEYLIQPDKKYQSSQKMIANFIKILLIKRLESGLKSFKKSINNTIKIHEKVISEFEKGKVYTSKGYNEKILQLAENDELEAIEDLIRRGKAKEYDASEFKDNFIIDLKSDLETFKKIKRMWDTIENYPKKDRLIELLHEINPQNNKKVIIFTEFIDTTKDLIEDIKKEITDKVMIYTGKSSKEERTKVIYNFDDNVKKEFQENDYNILITTDVLSHGVNLHRSNIIINYDIPWNPTKIMQRVGRIQRLGTKFKEIHTYNFFPVGPIEKTISVEQLAKNKIATFIELLGNDSQLLTEEPIQSYQLFNKLNADINNEEDEIDYEIKYLRLIRDIRDKQPELFKKIEEIPKKARVGRKTEKNTYLVTLMKTGKFKKVLKTENGKTTEIDFLQALNILRSDKKEKGALVNKKYYTYLNKNISTFQELIQSDDDVHLSKNAKKILKSIAYVNNSRKHFNSFDKDFIDKVSELVHNGELTKTQEKRINKDIEKTIKQHTEPNGNELKKEDDIDKILAFDIKDVLRYRIPDEFLNTQTKINVDSEKEVILSEYFIKGDVNY